MFIWNEDLNKSEIELLKDAFNQSKGQNTFKFNLFGYDIKNTLEDFNSLMSKGYVSFNSKVVNEELNTFLNTEQPIYFEIMFLNKFIRLFDKYCNTPKK